jgi:hypothetical protein
LRQQSYYLAVCEALVVAWVDDFKQLVHCLKIAIEDFQHGEELAELLLIDHAIFIDVYLVEGLVKRFQVAFMLAQLEIKHHF